MKTISKLLAFFLFISVLGVELAEAQAIDSVQKNNTSAEFISGIINENSEVNNNIEKVVTRLMGNHYSVTISNKNGDVLQTGQYFLVDDKLKPHGIWKLYDYNTLELVTTAEYDKGNQIWVETYTNGETIRVNRYEMEINRLKNRIAELESKIDGI